MFETPIFRKVNSLSRNIRVGFVEGAQNVTSVGWNSGRFSFCSNFDWQSAFLECFVIVALCIVSKLHSWFVILPGNNEDQLNIWISYYWDHRIKKWRLIIAFKDATYSVTKTVPEKFRLPDTVLHEPICNNDQLPVGLPAQLVRALHWYPKVRILIPVSLIFSGFLYYATALSVGKVNQLNPLNYYFPMYKLYIILVEL